VGCAATASSPRCCWSSPRRWSSGRSPRRSSPSPPPGRGTAPTSAPRDEKEAREDADRERSRAERELARAEALVYAGQLAVARREFASGNAEAAWQLLDSTRWDLRGWEYRRLLGEFTRSYERLGEHESRATAVAISPDGTLVASAGEDRIVHVRDAFTGELRHALDWTQRARQRRRLLARWADARLGRPGRHGQAVGRPDGQAALHPRRPRQGRQQRGVLAGRPPRRRRALDGTVRLWDVASGKPAGTLAPPQTEEPRELKCLAFSPDGVRLVVGGTNRTLEVWDVAQGKRLHQLAGHAGETTCVAYGPGGKQFVSGGEDNLLPPCTTPAPRRRCSPWKGTRTGSRRWRTAPTAAGSSPARWTGR